MEEKELYVVMYHASSHGNARQVWQFPAVTVGNKVVSHSGFLTEGQAIEGIKGIPPSNTASLGKVTFYVAKVVMEVEVKPVMETKITRL